MTDKERAAHLARWVLREITAPRMTLTPEQFGLLMQDVRDACAEIGVEPVDLYRYVVGKSPEIANAIRYGHQETAGACLRLH